MPLSQNVQLDLLTEHLASRRKVILQAWRNAVEADPQLTTARALSRGQLNDHIPQVLDAFEHKLRSRPGGQEAQAADRLTKKEEVKHGLHRWQQGYRLPELMREWGHLQLCLFDELDAFAAAQPEIERSTMVEVAREMISLVNEAVSESCKQYERMQQAEARGRMNDLETALASINEIERRRAALIREAVHDLNGNVLGVTVAAQLLGTANIPDASREEFSLLLQRGVQSVSSMLADLTELARLESGKETRAISEFDAGALVAELANTTRPIADRRGLFLNVEGPLQLVVDGDPSKVRRLLQNLLLNALKYTECGGVILTLGVENESWWLMVKDTGPGLQAGPSASLVVGMKEATASARESDEKAAAIHGVVSNVLEPSPGGSRAARPSVSQPGEGIGLSIVKRLCELLDASLEVASSPETGTTFRVVLPLRY
jgi:signal transduction histidine kinase